MQILETELDVWSLSEIDLGETCRMIRSDRILMLWTWIDSTATYALNLFAPQGYVFWDMGAFSAFSSGHHRFVQRLVERSEIRMQIRDLVLNLGHPLRSLFAWTLLGGLTRAFGDAFLPEVDASTLFRFASRVESFAVPAACRDAVSRYFHRQALVFGERATLALPEDREMVVSERARNSFPQWSRLLALPVPAFSSEQRKAVRLDLEGRSEELGLVRLNHDIDVSFGRPGDISLALPFRLHDAEALNDFLAIAAARIRVAMRISALPVLERLRDDLLTQGWEDIVLADLRASALEQLGNKLLSFPEMLANPFQLGNL